MPGPEMNLFAHATPPSQGERFDELLRHKNLVIERILSSPGIRSAEYVQAQDEWVLLVQGEAGLIVGGKPVRLVAGDHLFIPAGVPHTVVDTSEGALWLAVHLHPGAVAP